MSVVSRDEQGYNRITTEGDQGIQEITRYLTQAGLGIWCLKYSRRFDQVRGRRKGERAIGCTLGDFPATTNPGALFPRNADGLMGGGGWFNSKDNIWEGS